MHTGEKVGSKKETIKVCVQRSQWEHHAPLHGSRHQRQEAFYISKRRNHGLNSVKESRVNTVVLSGSETLSRIFPKVLRGGRHLVGPSIPSVEERLPADAPRTT